MSVQMSGKDPFAVLGIAPTLDQAEIKRAYFRALSVHGPHSDPEGFQRLRQVYEELGRPGGLSAAYLNSPLDVGAELARYEDRFGGALREAATAEAADAERLRFLETVWGLSYEEAVHLFHPPAP